MNEQITLTPAMMALVPVVSMIMQVIKGVPIYDKIKAYTPIVTMVIGIGAAYAASIANPIVAGILIGVTASAGYDSFKKASGK